jgi:surface carbohydrate biosynthesis protein
MSLLFEELSFSPRKWLFLPVETKARELQGKLFLAFVAAERGWGVLLGKRIHDRPYLPRGAYILKSISPGRLKFIRHLEARGCRVVAWCEEGMVYRNAEEYGRRRVEKASYDAVAAYFAWGEQQRHDMIAELGCDPTKMVVSGNPRFDLLRPDVRAVFSVRADQLRQIYGRIILVNTRFSRYNHGLGLDWVAQNMKRAGSISQPEHEEDLLGIAAFQKETFEFFMEAVRALSERYKNHTIIVRPHPSESHEPWKKLARNLNNVRVVYEGNVAEWIIASDVCIHNNCTTGVESYLLNQASISYRPVRDARFDMYLPQALCPDATTLSELMGIVDTTLSDEPLDAPAVAEQRTKVARHFIAGQVGPSASDTIVEALGSLEVGREPLNVRKQRLGGIRSRAARAIAPVRTWLDPKSDSVKTRYIRQKYDTTSLGEATDFLGSARRATGRFGEVAITKLEDDVFCVHRV